MQSLLFALLLILSKAEVLENHKEQELEGTSEQV